MRSVETILTAQMAPDQVIATLAIEFDDDLDLPKLEQLIARIEHGLRDKHPDLFRVFVRPTSNPGAFAEPQVNDPEVAERDVQRDR